MSRAGLFGPPLPEEAGARETLVAELERIVFRNEENGYTIAAGFCHPAGDRVTIVGSFPGLSPPDRIEAQGRWSVHPRFGRQFLAECVRFVPPSTVDEIRDYLSTGIVRGIGAKTAEALVRAFGDRTLEVLDLEPDRVSEVPGLKGKRGIAILDAWRAHKGVRDLFLFLHGLGIGAARAARIHRLWGADAMRRIRDDPYALADEVEGIGFLTADRVAQGLGIEADAPRRLEAGLRHVLQEACEGEGHACLSRSILAGRTGRLLECPAESLEAALERAIAARRISVDPDFPGDVWLPALLEAERSAAVRLLEIANAPLSPAVRRAAISAKVGASRLERLSADQREAALAALRGKVSAITGGPGVGKTTLLADLLRFLAEAGAKIALAAPTGRAAKRLSEATGFEAKTLHRLLLYDPHANEWGRNRDRPLPVDFVCVDEASMIDLPLLARLVDATPPEASLLFVGDADQLPSVGPGTVLDDLLSCGRFPVSRLTEIFRQAGESEIVRNAHRVNRGEIPDLTPARFDAPWGDFLFFPARDAAAAADLVVRLASDEIPRRLGIDPVSGLQVLVPMHKGDCGAEALNKRLRAALNPSAPAAAPFAPGDKVMQIRNDYDKEVFNGDVGRVSALDAQARRLAVRFPDKEVAYGFDETDTLARAYAVTIHKSQGSEYGAVVVAILREHRILLQRNLLYTAITRGRRLVAIVGDPAAVAMAVRRAHASRRLGRLCERLGGTKAAEGDGYEPDAGFSGSPIS